jgi:hypothetical protein
VFSVVNGFLSLTFNDKSGVFLFLWGSEEGDERETGF